MSSAGESRRRAEIEAKRAKLAELKKAREERTSRLQAGRSDSKTVSEATTPSSRKDLDDFVSTLVGSSRGVGGGSSSTGVKTGLDGALTPSSPRKSVSVGLPTSEYGDSEGGPSAVPTYANRSDGELQGVPSMKAKLVDSEVQTDSIDSAKKVQERVYYTKEVQTTAIDSSDEEDRERRGDIRQRGKISASAEEAIRAKILKEQEIERLKVEEERLRQQEQRLEQEIEEKLRELSAEELTAIFGTSDFTDFVEQSSKIVERALTDSYDYLKDYRILDDRAADDYEGRQVKCQRVFWDEQLCKGRSITDIGWSTKHPELVVASYSRSDSTSTETPDGLVLVWNLHLADRPEFVFYAQTDVLSVCFSPFHPNLVIGGTYSGQILIWDTRAKSLPVLKTPLSATGHTHPVYSIQMVGTQNAYNLITASTDGMVCSWMLDMLARPQEVLELLNTSHAKTDEVSITVLGFPDQETTNFWIGTEDGNVYQAARYDRAGYKAGLNLAEVYRGHAAPVTGLHFHPFHGPVDFSDLFLSSSMDWTSRLWRLKGGHVSTSASSIGGNIKSGTRSTANSIGLASVGLVGDSITPILTLEESNDYVYDVAWHTIHPAIFAQVDGSGKFDLFNLNVDYERPVVSINVGISRALNKVKWDKKEGRRLATGGADGKLYIFDVGNMAIPREEEWIELQKVISSLISGKQAVITNAKSSMTDGNKLSRADATFATPIRPTNDLDRLNQRLAVR